MSGARQDRRRRPSPAGDHARPCSSGRGGRLALVCVAAALALAAGCKSRPAPVRRPLLVEVVVHDRTPPAERPARLDVAAVREEILRGQRAAAVFAVEPGRKPGPTDEAYRLQADVSLEEDVKDGQGLARAVVAVVIERIGGPADVPRHEAGGGAERPYPLETRDVGAVFTGLVQRAIGDLAKGLVQRIRLRRADAGAVVAAIRSDDPESRLAAVNVAADRRERAAVPALIERLGDPVEAVRDRALGALVEIGDRRAVGPLTRQTQFRDLNGMRKVVDAIGSLGGDEARAYLELVASGHEDRDIRELAKESLDRLRRKAARARGRL